MEFEKARSFLMGKLENELPAYLTYHDAQHTKDVIEAAEYLGRQEKINDRELTLLKTAALFHDSGFLQDHQEHEELSCNLARRWLPEFNYTSDEIDSICNMIRTTKLPQSAEDHLSQLLCDADLYYLGGDEYESNAKNLYKEFLSTGMVKSRAEWDVMQLEFLSSHHFFSRTAIQTREEKKKTHLQQLRANVGTSFHPTQKSHAIEIMQDVLLILFGVLISGFALKGFLVPNHFFDGGITGISLLLHDIYGFNLALTILILNIPLIIVGYYSVGKRFAFRTFISIVLLGLCIFLLPDYALTKDKLLIAIFGGFFLGIGIGLIMRSGAALDGTDVLAVYTFNRTSFSMTEIILAINIVIFAVAAFQYGLETGLYSILTYLAATKSIDYVVEGLQAYTGVTIISGKSEMIKYHLVNKLGRGITVYHGERGFLPGSFHVSSDCDIIFTVITRLELRKLKNVVSEVDPQAFVFANTIKEASGGIIKRRSQH